MVFDNRVVVLLIEEDTAHGWSFIAYVLGSLPDVDLRTASSWLMASRMIDTSDVIVADLDLPEVKESICRLAASLPVVVYTNELNVELKQECEKAGVVGFLVKHTTSVNQLQSIVELAISRTRRRMTESEIGRFSSAQMEELKGFDLK